VRRVFVGPLGHPMLCPSLSELPPAPPGKTGWPWTNSSAEAGAPSTEQGELSANVSHLTSHVSLPHSPRISIVMPCLNAGRYIEEALRSVLLQSYPSLELFVYDGGSTDGTIEVIKRYEQWVTYWESAKDRGQSHAINKGLARATGALFNWANADDIMCPNAFHTLVALYSRQMNCVGVFGAMEVFDEGGYRKTWQPNPGSKEEIGEWGLSAFLPQPSALFPCQLCKDIGGMNEALHYVMDIELILRLADHGSFAVTNTPTYRYRHHSEAKTVKGEIAGMVELIASEFNLGMTKVAERWLKWRMEGFAKVTLGELTPVEVAKMMDGWGYGKLARYLAGRLWKNIRLRILR